jgi:hypothetical protein
MVLPSTLNMSKFEYTISRNDGYINLGFLSTMLPPLPGGPNWADKTKVFFKVEVSKKDEIPGLFVNPNENRVNLYIYDKFSGRYIYSSDGYSIIPYSELYGWRVVERYDGRSIIRQKYNDIIVQASTNY